MAKEKIIDLHMHLDGSVTVEIAKKLAELQGIVLPFPNDDELKRHLTVPGDCESLNDFLKCFSLPLSLMQTKEGISEAVYLISESIKRDGIIYAEIRFAPQLHTGGNLTQEDAVLAAMSGIERTDLKVNIILCLMRGKGNEALNEETLLLAKKYLTKDKGVVAIDLAGAEAVYPTEDYRYIFERARNLNIPFTIHAGEAAGPESVKLAIQYGAKRIGHGVRIYEDPEVVRLVKERGITLEMCPTSNRVTRAVDDMSKYPLMDYLRNGIKITLNTDDMGILGITLPDEFRYMRDKFGLSREDERVLLNNSIDAAFTTDEVKEELRNMTSIILRG